MDNSKVMILKANCDAMHKLGNLKREEDSHVFVIEDDESHYKGQFLEGFGYIDIIFKKEDIREMSDLEYNEYIHKIITMGSMVWSCLFTKRDGSDMTDEEKKEDCYEVLYVKNNDNTIRFKELENKRFYISKRTEVGKSLLVFDTNFIYAFNSSKLLEKTIDKNNMINFKSKNSNFQFKII